jgi:hypothetical protein
VVPCVNTKKEINKKNVGKWIHLSSLVAGLVCGAVGAISCGRLRS